MKRCARALGRLLVDVALLMAFSSCVLFCSNEKGREAILTKKQVISPQNYLRSEKTSPLGKLELFSITENGLKQEETKVRGAHFVEITVPTHFRTKAYKQVGPGASNLTFVVPKILFRTQANAPKTAKVDSILHGTIALVDGLTSQIGSSFGPRGLPRDLAIPNKSDFLKLIEKEVGSSPSFVGLVPVPSNISIDLSEKSFELSIPKRVTALPLNTHTPVSSRMTSVDYAMLRRAFLEPKSTKVSVRLELKTPTTLEYGTLRLDKPSLHIFIQERLQREAVPLSPMFVDNLLERVTSHVAGDFGISEETLSSSGLRNAVIEEFFTPLYGNNCPRSFGSCYFPKARATSGNLALPLRRDTFLGPSLRLDISTPLVDAFSEHQEFLLATAQSDLLTPPTAGTINNILRSIKDDDIVEFRINRLSLTTLQLETPKVEHIPKQTCLDPYSMCTAGKWKCVSQEIEKVNPRQVCTGGYREECVERCHIFSNPNSGKENHRECRATNPSDPHDRNPTRPCTDRDVCVRRENICLGWTTVYDERRTCDKLTPPENLALPHRVYAPPQLEKLHSQELEKLGYLRMRTPIEWRHLDDCPNSPLVKVVPEKEYTVRRIYPNFDWECSKQTHNHCDKDKWQDSWEKVTTFSHPFAGTEYKEQTLNKSHLSTILAGVEVKFASMEKGSLREVKCPITSLPIEILSPSRFTVTFTNTESCRPFTAENRLPNFNPSLSILNRISIPQEFQCGTLWENFEGKRRYTCRLPDGRTLSRDSSKQEDERLESRGERTGIYSLFYPRARVQGTLRVVGQELTNGDN